MARVTKRSTFACKERSKSIFGRCCYCVGRRDGVTLPRAILHIGWCRLLWGLQAADSSLLASCLLTVIGLLNLRVRILAEWKVGSASSWDTYESKSHLRPLL